MSMAPVQEEAGYSGVRAALSAALIMAVGMGFGRFAYTAIYPYMLEDGVVSLHGGGLVASANYAGYLLGALLAVRVRAPTAHSVCLWSVTGTILCLAALTVVEALPLLIALRGLAGVFSALAMVSVSLWLFVQQQQMHRAPLLYAGVGIGIALSAELVALGVYAGLQSQGLWLLLSLVSLGIGLFVLPVLWSGRRLSATPGLAATVATQTVRPQILVAAYGLAGFGYIITATYLPVLVQLALPEFDPAHVWALFGLGAIPSCFLWHHVHQRLGTRRCLAANLGLQAIGVALPVLVPSAVGYLLSALLVGGTFMGTVTIALPAAQRVAREGHSSLIAIMTLVYGIGQIIGPLAASALHAVSQTFSSSLLLAAGALLVATVLSISSL